MEFPSRKIKLNTTCNKMNKRIEMNILLVRRNGTGGEKRNSALLDSSIYVNVFRIIFKKLNKVFGQSVRLSDYLK